MTFLAPHPPQTRSGSSLNKFNTMTNNLSLIKKRQNTLIPTLNHYGYALSEPDLYSKKFVDFSNDKNSPCLEIGAAYGFSTIAALKKGASGSVLITTFTLEELIPARCCIAPEIPIAI